MTNSGKRRRSEKRAQEQLKALYEVRSMPVDNIVTTKGGGIEWQQNKVSLSQINMDILRLEKKLLLVH